MSDPFSTGGFDPRMFEQVPLFRELAKVMAWQGGPVNWDLARQTAEALADDRRAGTATDEDLAEAVSVAELWLDAACGLPAVEGPARVMTPSAWAAQVTATDGIGPLVEPVAKGMTEALGQGLPEELGEALGGQAAGAQLHQAMGAIGAMLYGVQVGTITGNLAQQVLGCYDLGVPVAPPRTIGTVGDALDRFGEAFAFEPTELRYWHALRECAHRRVYAGVPWLGQHLSGLVGRFASEADLDAGRMMEAFGGMGFDPSDPSAVQEALEGPDAFELEPTDAQRRVLDELQALVSFVDGYVGAVTDAAADGRLASLPRLDEALRRHRAEHGPGERFLAQLIGLDLKPADLRTGRTFCDAVIAARGVEGLDRAWRDAAHLPGAAELEEPSRWLVRMAAAELDEGDEAS